MTLSEQQLECVRLIVEGKTHAECAAALGVHKRTIDNWKTLPEFRRAVREEQNAWRETARAAMDTDWRLRYLIDRHRRLTSIIDEREKDPAMENVPGGKSGLLTVKYKMLNRVDEGGNRISEPVPEFEVDTGTLAELRAIEHAIAVERHEWNPRSTVETKKTTRVEISAEVRAIAAMLTPAQAAELQAKVDDYERRKKALPAPESE